MTGRGMGGHHSAKAGKDEWLTPPEIIAALGPFDLDPCAPVVRPWPTAATHYTIEDDGLTKPWDGLVWLNPPYGAATATWLRRLREHGTGIALVFARTETDWFADAWAADALLFLAGRLFSHHVDGRRAAANAGAPSVFLAYGPEAVARLRRSGLNGALITAVERLGQPRIFGGHA